MNPAKRKKFYRLSLKSETAVVPEVKEEVKVEPKKEIKIEELQEVKEQTTVEQQPEAKTADSTTVAKKKKVVNESV